MINTKEVPVWFWKVALVVVTVIWGGSFLVMKDAVNVVSSGWLQGIRFIACAVLMALFFFGKLKRHFDKKHLVAGLVLGVFNFLMFYIQNMGLQYTTAGKGAFLTACYCVLVPFLAWIVIHKKPTKYNIIAALFCIAGVYFIAVNESFSVGFGDAVVLSSAIFFGLQMVFANKYADEGRDIFVITTYQFLVSGILGVIIGATTETLPPFESMMNTDFIISIAYLVVLASCFALLVQNLALAKVPASQASLFLSLESVFGVIFSVLLTGEILTIKMIIGFVLVFAALVVSESFPLKKKVELADEPVAGESASSTFF